MKLDDFLDDLHKYREERASELDGLTSEEAWKKMNEPGIAIAEQLGFTIMTAESETVAK